MLSKQEVFNKVYEHFEAGKGMLPYQLAHEAKHHGIRIETVKRAVLAAEDKDDFDDE